MCGTCQFGGLERIEPRSLGRKALKLEDDGCSAIPGLWPAIPKPFATGAPDWHGTESPSLNADEHALVILFPRSG